MYYFQVENSPSLKRTTLLKISPPETLLTHQALVEPPQNWQHGKTHHLNEQQYSPNG